jgi:hypothetical protein
MKTDQKSRRNRYDGEQCFKKILHQFLPFPILISVSKKSTKNPGKKKI